MNQRPQELHLDAPALAASLAGGKARGAEAPDRAAPRRPFADRPRILARSQP